MDQLPTSTLRLYFATGIHWKEWNDRGARRLSDLTTRRGCVIPFERPGNYDGEDQAYRASDGIICLGNHYALDTFRDFARVVSVNNAAYPVSPNSLRSRDYSEARSHFLFLAGRGNVHKGLDLLLEAFAHTELHLHICQHLQPDFARAFRYELTECSNIHFEGFVKMRSRQFLDLAVKCNWVILPTCAEGQPGSVLECMAYGMVPIVTREANINLEDYGIDIPELSVESVRTMAYLASQMSTTESQRRSRRTAEVAQQRYSVEAFRSGFKSAVLHLESLNAANTRR